MRDLPDSLSLHRRPAGDQSTDRRNAIPHGESRTSRGAERHRLHSLRCGGSIIEFEQGGAWRAPDAISKPQAGSYSGGFSSDAAIGMLVATGAVAAAL